MTLCDLMGCHLPTSSLHEILQARILEWVAISFSRGSSWPRDPTQVSCIAGRFFIVWAGREVYCKLNILQLKRRTWPQVSRSTSGDFFHTLILLFCIVLTQEKLAWVLKKVANGLSPFISWILCVFYMLCLILDFSFSKHCRTPLKLHTTFIGTQ